jgi:methylenetetrahydrofolate dehydrogenase (NADP+)/methenyltetrahydrofolate cyclohydrolase
MTAKIIDGKAVAQKIRADIAKQVAEIKKTTHKVPGLAVILLGNDAASEVYVANKEKAAHAVGMNSLQFRLAAETSQEELLKKVFL